MTLFSENDLRLAEQLTLHSIELQEGDNVMIQLVGLNGIGLVRALANRLRDQGAHPFIRIEDSATQQILLEKGDGEFWENQADADQLPLMKKMDAFIGIRAAENIYEYSGVSGKANEDYSKFFLNPVHFKQRVEHTRWVVLRYPSPAFAMNARMSTDRFIDFYYNACLLNYTRLEEAMKPLEKMLRETDIIHLKGEGTDIRFSVKGQNWIPCFGKRNIPDGELFSSPLIDSVNGEITYAPSVYQGKPFEFVKLRVKDGIVTEFDSSNNDALNEILETDDGAKRFGEFSFGLNPVIESPMYDILFDEKIYGSNHLTLGKDYAIAANGNSSNIHWDLVCIGADVLLDGELVRKGRLFIKEELKGLNPDSLLL
ncbi:MAG: aminopeptidase [Balneolaceae bacterium]|nr:MAG: aminopeptidase [Balneolaceae bacterium]